jgi:hypothetical protein
MNKVKNAFITKRLESIVLVILVSLLALSGNVANAQGNSYWQRVGTGDCAGNDVDSSDGFMPDNGKAKAGYTAVCWDGSRYNNMNSPGRAFCTYKNITSDRCTGGSNTGVLYRGVGWTSSIRGSLISFISGPDPEGITPVYYLGGDGQLHHVQSAAVASKWFGANWISQIRWCGDSERRILPNCKNDFARPRGCPITNATPRLP